MPIDAFNELADAVAETFSPPEFTYHLRVRGVESVNTTTGRETLAETYYAITGGCFRQAVRQGFHSNPGGVQRPDEEVVFTINWQTLLDAELAEDAFTDDWDQIVQDRSLGTQIRWRIISADRIAGGAMWRVTCKQDRNNPE